MPSLTTAAALAREGLVAPERVPGLERVARRYAVAVTPAMAAISRGDDAMGRQFLPSEAELEVLPEELADPVGDAAHSPVKGIVHRYPDRVLLIPTHACAVYCRFCFRREVVGPGGDGTLTEAELETAVAYVAACPAIWEVIVTGGDPLTLSPRRLRAVMGRLAAIPHVRVVRLHTRVPAVDPERVTPELMEALGCGDKAVWVGLHANHPRELTEEARAACARLVDAGFPMVSQTVLLRGVNDDPATLEALLRGFVEMRIKPYYLHQADLAPGTSHLRTTIAEGRALLRDLRGRVSGLAQPAYVLDIPGGFGKAPIGPVHLQEGGAEVEDPQGVLHRYPPRV